MDIAVPSIITCGASRSGLCKWTIAATEHTYSANFQGSTYGEVFVDGPGRMSARWLSGRLYGEIPEIGGVVMRYREEAPSTVAIHSESPGGDPFFPATAEQRLFYALDVIDEGAHVSRSLVNIAAMPMQATIHTVPPYGTDFTIGEDVTFVDDSTNPPTRVITLRGDSTGRVENPGGIDVTPTVHSLDANTGRFAMSFDVRRVDAGPERAVIWWVEQIHQASLGRSDREGIIASGARVEAAVEGTYNPEDEFAGIVCHAITPDGPVAEGHSVVYFAAVGD